MFDRKTIINKRSTEYVPYEKTVNITEKKAPTDESVRLLKELEEKAEDKLIKKIVINNNTVNGTIFIYEDCWDIFQLKLAFRFFINEKEYIIKDITVEKDYYKYNLSSKESLSRYTIKKFFKVISEEIAKVLIEQNLKEVHNFIQKNV